MIFKKLHERMSKWHLGQRTLLGVGPMSKNVVDATIEVANGLKVPIQLIASRRQIEFAELGASYAGWDTENFAAYVRQRDKGNHIILARDHGGPWQGSDETKLSQPKAMQRAKRSYVADVQAGFDVLHLDPSLRDRSIRLIKKDITTLFEYCESLGRDDLIYECGTEETNGKITNNNSFREFVSFSKSLSPKVKFVVGQTGTLVKETRNVGVYDKAKARDLVAICNEHEVFLKEHNLDYAHQLVLHDHRLAGIHSANVAPEFGVVETKKLLALLETHKLQKLSDRFLELSFNSKKWEKWVISDLSNTDKAIISGHYIFNTPEVCGIKEKLNKVMDTDLDTTLKSTVTSRILYYLKAFTWTV